jgi:Alternative complex III, ActD subunit
MFIGLRKLFCEGEHTMANNTPRQDQNSVVAIFSQHSTAENAIKELKGGGFDIKKLAVVGRDYQTEEDVVGFYNTGDRMKYWGKWGAFWGGLWGLLFGAAFLIVPGIGPVVAAGSIVTWIVAALEGAVVVGGLSALGAGLYSLGIPKNSVVKYETSIKAGKFVLVAHGTAEEVARARDMLKTSGAEQIDTYQPSTEAVRAA